VTAGNSSSAATRVPREYLGAARQFHRELESDAKVVIDAMRRVADPAMKWLKTHPRIRPEMAAATVRAWREEVPASGLLSLETVAQGKTLTIRDLRLSPARHERQEWENLEPIVCVMLTWMTVQRGHFRLDNVLLAAVNLHAIARRLQRGFDNSRPALMADLRALAEAATTVADTRGPFHVPVRGGAWGGNAVDMEVPVKNGAVDTHRVLSVRTYLGGDDFQQRATDAPADAPGAEALA
jgi:hypothetical protein